MTARKVPAAEVKRLARIRELAQANRRSTRALDRAIKAAAERGISIRKIAAAAGMPVMTVWKIARTDGGQPDAATEDAKPAAKPKRRGT